jgi:hypothetical protein
VIIVPPSDFFQPLASSETIMSFKKGFQDVLFLSTTSRWALKQIYIFLPQYCCTSWKIFGLKSLEILPEYKNVHYVLDFYQ